MSAKSTNLGQRVANRRGPQQSLGAGAQSRRVAEHVRISFKDFSGGVNKAVMPHALNPRFAAEQVDMQVDQRNRLITWNGVSINETFAGGRSPTTMFPHGNARTGTTELVLIDGEFLGLKASVSGATIWSDANLPVGGAWVACVQGDELVLSNGVGSVYTRQIGDVGVTNAGWGPARALMSFAARVFGGGVTLLGDYEPLGVYWTGATSLPNDTGLGSGFEILYDDVEGGDYIVSMRSLGFDFAAILTRRAVWVAQRTGNATRPASFSPRAWGDGAVNDACVVKVPQGLIYLSDSGIKLFDGNAVTHISDAIDADILPLDFSKLGEYSAVYNSFTSEYVLFTPFGTFHYALREQRWTKRSLVALRAVSVFATGGAESLSDETIGGWNREWNRSWGRTGGGGGAGPSVVQSDLFYLEPGRLLIDSDTTTYAGDQYVPVWESAEIDIPDAIDGMYTIDNVSVRYTGGGNLQLFTPDELGGWQLFRSVTTPETTEPRTIDFYGNTTGVRIGVRVVVASGRFRIEALALRGLPRSSRRWTE